MKKVFIDTETTGLNPGEIIQLTYCICDIDTSGRERVCSSKNFFLHTDYVEPSAEAVHGFSVDRLKLLSKGQTFKDIYLEVKEDLKDSMFVAHNVKFDKKFVKAEFDRLSNCNWNPQKFFCTMEYFKPIVQAKGRGGRIKKPRLEETMDFLKIDKNTVLKGAKRLFGCDDVDFHDARYDVAALVSCYYRAKKLGYDL
ncbi:3'-5' exonuclease [Clostridium oceanicum]|uniref:3'-5' exonuclease n=1 Tax=Clostridium oceanicum TaxID=1543 RepID=A0ABN1J9F2_9CLOT